MKVPTALIHGGVLLNKRRTESAECINPLGVSRQRHRPNITARGNGIEGWNQGKPLICTLPACGTLQPKFGVAGDHTTRTQRRSP